MRYSKNFNTKILFGKDQVTALGAEILPFGQKVLLLYGKGSIKKNGIFDAVVAQFKEHDIQCVELGGATVLFSLVE